MAVDRLQSIEVFLKVAQLGSFSAAADQLAISKSTVSKYVAALEQRLAVRLLNRTTRRLSLTEAGERYRDRCLAIIQEIEDTELSMASMAAEPRGRLKVNAPMSFGVLHLSPLLPMFMQRFPQIEVDLTLNDRRVDLIDEGYDLAVRIGELDDSSLIVRKLTTTYSVCAAGPDYLDRRRQPQHPDDLRRHNCLQYTYSRSPGEWLFRGADGDVRVQVSGSFAANNGEALSAAAAAGLGITYQPLFILADLLAAGALRPVLRAWDTPPIDIHAVYPSGRHVSPKLRAFVDFLASELRQRPGVTREMETAA